MPDRPADLVAALEADLAALAAADADLVRDAEVAERTRIERGSVTLEDRLRAAGSVEVALLGGWRRAGRVVEVGDGWILLAGAPGEHLVALGSVVTLLGLGRAVSTSGPLGARSMTSVLRAWCRDRSSVTACLGDGSSLTGLASAAYRDHLEIATDGPGGSVVVPFAALVAVTR